jgi:hypothetical protein
MNNTDSKNTPLYRIFKVVYFILGIPFWVGLIFWVYILVTEEFHLELFTALLIYLIIIAGLKSLARYILLGRFG